MEGTGSTMRLAGTLPEIMFIVEQRFMDGVADGQMHEDIASLVSHAFVHGTNGDLFTLLVLVRGLHSAAEAHRCNGNQWDAGLLYSLGQDLLAQAVDTYAESLAFNVRIHAVTRH